MQKKVRAILVTGVIILTMRVGAGILFKTASIAPQPEPATTTATDASTPEPRQTPATPNDVVMAANGYSSISVGDSGNWVDVRNDGDNEVIKLSNPALQARIYINDMEAEAIGQDVTFEQIATGVAKAYGAAPPPVEAITLNGYAAQQAKFVGALPEFADINMALQILLLEAGDRAYMIVANVPADQAAIAQAEVEQILQTFTPLSKTAEVSQSLPQ